MKLQNEELSPSDLKVDVEAVLNKRLPSYAHLIPKPLIQWLKRTLCQDELNGILERTKGKTGAEFCDAVLNDLNVSYTFKGERPNPANTRVLIVCNHPLGGLDGIAMIHWVSSIYGPDVHFIVNEPESERRHRTVSCWRPACDNVSGRYGVAASERRHTRPQMAKNVHK